MRFFKAFIAHALTACVTFGAVVVFLLSGRANIYANRVMVFGPGGDWHNGIGTTINHGGIDLSDGKSAIWINLFGSPEGKQAGPFIAFWAGNSQPGRVIYANDGINRDRLGGKPGL